MTDTGYKEFTFDINVDSRSYKELAKLTLEELKHLDTVFSDQADSVFRQMTQQITQTPALFMPPPESLQSDFFSTQAKLLRNISGAYGAYAPQFFDYAAAVADAAEAIERLGLSVDEVTRPYRQRRAIIILIVVMVALTLVIGGLS